jgi:hypothetical protein
MGLFSMKGLEVRLCAISPLQDSPEASASAQPDASWRSKRLPTTPRPKAALQRGRSTTQFRRWRLIKLAFEMLSASGASDMFERTSCIPLSLKQSILQKVVVLTRPVSGFTKMSLLQKAESGQQCQRRLVFGMYLRLDSVQVHCSKAPGDD